MKYSSVVISTIVFFFTLVTISHAVPPRQNGLQPGTKAQVKAMQKQLVKNAKAVLKTTKKDIKISNKEYRAASQSYTNAVKADQKAYEKMAFGKTQKTREQGRKEVAVTSRKVMETGDAMIEAYQRATKALIKHGQAKQNLNGIRKQGWQQFFENQRARTSVALPRLVRDQGGTIDSNKFKQDLEKALHKNAYTPI